MKIAIVGYGKMGRMIERMADSRGHEVIARFDIGLATETPQTQRCRERETDCRGSFLSVSLSLCLRTRHNS
jgi:prephenate dehydrogenase